jgi:hypothetical protein
MVKDKAANIRFWIKYGVALFEAGKVKGVGVSLVD